MEPLPLTGREREIGILIGQGLSNQEVAQRLTLSKRTVESHLYRAMAKTGTTSRDGFAALLRKRINIRDPGDNAQKRLDDRQP
jgi:DNA-binding CsgD family transcriptional regulator